MRLVFLGTGFCPCGVAVRTCAIRLPEDWVLFLQDWVLRIARRAFGLHGVARYSVYCGFYTVHGICVIHAIDSDASAISADVFVLQVLSYFVRSYPRGDIPRTHEVSHIPRTRGASNNMFISCGWNFAHIP